MEITVKREKPTAISTPGLMFFGKFECYTLEPTEREQLPNETAEEYEAADGWKIPGLTAIPCGRYRVMLTYSPHFGKILPELVDVPGFGSVRIHGGNVPKDTKACTLVGQERSGHDAVLHSQAALEGVMQKISAAIEAGEEVWITYTDVWTVDAPQSEAAAA